MTDKDWSVPDWSREKPIRFWDPGNKLLKSIRDYQSLDDNNFIQLFKKKVCVLRHRFWSVIAAADIPINSNIGGGLLLKHTLGVVVHPEAKIGANCMLLQHCTITEGVTIGFHVDVGAGAVITEFITLGDHVRIGANAVVTKDFESNLTIAGVPAKKIDDWMLDD